MGKLGALTDTERLEGTRCVNQKVSAVAQARKDIEAGYAVDGTKVEDVLKPLSLVPAQVSRLSFIQALKFMLCYPLSVCLFQRPIRVIL